MQPKALPNHAARLVSDGGFADTATGDDSEAGGGTGWQCLPVGQKTALGQALTVIPVGPEIRTGLDTVGLWKARS